MLQSEQRQDVVVKRKQVQITYDAAVRHKSESRMRRVCGPVLLRKKVHACAE